MLERLYEAIKRGRAQLSLCGVHFLFETKGFKTRCEDLFLNIQPFIPNRVMEKRRYINRFFSSPLIETTVATWNKLYHRDIWRELRYPEGRLYEDVYVITPVLDQVDRVALVRKRMYQYRQRAGSTIHNRSRLVHLDMMGSYIRIVTYLIDHGYRGSAIFMQAALAVAVQEFYFGCEHTEAYVRRRKELTRDLVEQLDRVSVKSVGPLFYVMIRVIALWAKLTSHKRIRVSGPSDT